MNNHRAPELHPWLLGDPSPETRKHRCLYKLGEAVNQIIALIERLKTSAPLLREPERYPNGPLREHFDRRDALSAIESGDYKKAAELLAAYAVPAEKPAATREKSE